MYYRRKIILAILELFDNRLDKVRLQKLLMLVTKQQQKPDFYFIPYKYGCYSFQANSDLNTMIKYNQVEKDGHTWKKTDNEKYIFTLKERDRMAVRYVKQMYGEKNTDELIYFTYIKYPYLAINSTIAKDRLNVYEYQMIVEARPILEDTILYTIGYEGVSLEEYLNKLIVNDIKVLCDVRKNPYSMKFGFSKALLQKACEGIGVEYIHIPELGIDSDKRQELNSQMDYDTLFSMYRKDILPLTVEYQEKVLSLLVANKRIALTCFEANINQCHRKHLAEAIANLPGFKYKLKHL